MTINGIEDVELERMIEETFKELNEERIKEGENFVRN